MIPLLAVPVLGRPDLLTACVASIDAPVRRLLIIDNSPEGGLGDVESALDEKLAELFLARDAVVLDEVANGGVAFGLEHGGLSVQARRRGTRARRRR